MHGKVTMESENWDTFMKLLAPCPMSVSICFRKFTWLHLCLSDGCWEHIKAQYVLFIWIIIWMNIHFALIAEGPTLVENCFTVCYNRRLNH